MVLLTYLVAILVLLIYGLLAWLTGAWLRLPAPSIWILRALLWVIGIVGFAVFVWFDRRKRRESSTEPDNESSDGGDLHLLFREANRKLALARSPGRIANLPLFLVAGQPGSAKTSIILHSGLHPELLAGQTHSGHEVAPTRLVNIWLAGGAVFVEASGAFLADPAAWRRLLELVKPGRFSSVVSGKRQAPRSVLLCFDAELFTRAGAQEKSLEAARTLRSRLSEFSASIGSEIPTYVVITRFDRVPFFTEFVTPLEESEASQVFGATLPLQRGQDAGIWGERQTALLSGMLNDLSFHLDRFRPELLDRENDRAKRPGIYEFPREFRKLRKPLAEFLVELCRPSQLTSGPFLRGVYMTGVRPVLAADAGGAAVQSAPLADVPAPSEATSYFRAPSAPAPPVMRPAQRKSQRVPQWIFLNELFSNVFLKDQLASALSGASVTTSLYRRVLFALATVLCLAGIALLGVSWFHNRALEREAAEAASAVQASPAASSQLAPVEALRRLDSLRQLAATLSDYKRDGAPVSYRWGLYVGNAIYPNVRQLYFERFRQLLLAQTQQVLVNSLRSLPASPGPAYESTYESLKAYLITTSNPEKSTRAFLSPVLLARWLNGRDVDSERQQLARKQFDFYSDQLLQGNPFSSANDGYAIEKARRYLSQFAGAERVYTAMLAEAAKTNPPINFNARFPGSAQVLVDPHEVRGAFTKGGWDFMTNAMRDPERYFAGEQWVLGPQTTQGMDAAQLGAQLRSRYVNDMENEWRAYLKAAAFLRYTGLPDAAHKLNIIAGNQSPLLELLSLAAQNTAVKDSALTAAFQPVQTVAASTADGQLISPANQPYMRALLTLQGSVEQLAGQNPPSDAGSAQVLSDAANAKVLTRQIAQGFRPDPSGKVDALTQKLMEDPITQVESLLKVLGPAELNGKGKSLCAQMRPLTLKYPFNPISTADAGVPEVNAVFRKPDGALWSFYDQSLQKLLLPAGSRFVANPAAPAKITPSFLNFFNNAVSISGALYSGGGPDPKFTYTLTPIASEGIEQLGLTIDGQTAVLGGPSAAPKTFTWQAAGAHEVKATVRFGSGPDLLWAHYEGLWAVFRFFDRAGQWQPNGARYDVDWTIRAGDNPIILPSGRPLTVRLNLDMAGSPPILERGYLSKAVCTAAVAN